MRPYLGCINILDVIVTACIKLLVDRVNLTGDLVGTGSHILKLASVKESKE